MIESRSPQRPDDVVVLAECRRRPDRSRPRSSGPARHSGSGRPAAPRPRPAALDAAADGGGAAADELTDLVVREVGKPRGEAAGEVGRSVAILRYYAQQVFDPIGAVHDPSLAGLLVHRRADRAAWPG